MKVKVYLAISKSMVKGKEYDFDATVEAVYGDYSVEGNKIKLDHHNSRATNIAPCCYKGEPLKDGKILISKINLNIVGGCAALMGIKPPHDLFWNAAAFLDVNGRHHLHELPKKLQDMINAYDAWAPKIPYYKELTDVTMIIYKHIQYIERIIAGEKKVIEKGRLWYERKHLEEDANLYYEYTKVRAFLSEGFPCASAYYSKEKKKVFPATITLNKRYNSITIAFADGGKKVSAIDVVQKLWGPEAGGKDGIAGSPRNWEKDMEELYIEFHKAIEAVENIDVI